MTLYKLLSVHYTTLVTRTESSMAMCKGVSVR